MSERDKRQKALDVFKETDFFLAKKASFDEAFSEIENLTVNIKEDGRGINQYNSESSYNKRSLPGEYINCHNRLCYNGGFNIGRIIREMIRNKQIELETYEICQGYNGSPKGRRNYGPCSNSFSIKVLIKYKDNIVNNK